MQRRRATGFLLIEVLAALTVAAIGLAALIRFQVEIQRAATLSLQRADALAIAAMQLETLRAGIHAGDVVAAGGIDEVGQGPDDEPLPSATVYTREWRLTPAGGVVYIDVSASWTGAGDETFQLTLCSAATAGAARDSGLLAMRTEFIGLP